jgi:diapolycopene oxygenase
MSKVIVIGGGLGGIGAAVSLAAKGFDVELYEKNTHLGGKLNQLARDGFLFDLGPSILTMPEIFERLFARAGKRMADYVAIRELRPHWRNFFEDGRIVDLYPTAEETVARNEGFTARDREQLARFLEYSRGLYEAACRGYFEKGLDTFWGLVKFHGLFAATRAYDASSRTRTFTIS